MTYTSWNIKHGGKKVRQCRADRMEHAKRFRAMLADLGLKHPDAAKLLKRFHLLTVRPVADARKSFGVANSTVWPA